MVVAGLKRKVGIRKLEEEDVDFCFAVVELTLVREDTSSNRANPYFILGGAKPKYGSLLNHTGNTIQVDHLCACLYLMLQYHGM